jgi:ABC-type amino acid transport substrate-binding protein
VLRRWGCGAAAGPEAAPPPPPPKLAKATADRLVARSDTIALKLAAGDECGAAHEADALNADAIAAVNAGEIPAAFQEELVARTQELVNAVNCPPPVVQPQPQAEEEQGDEGPGRGKKKGHENEKRKKKGKG